jgi:hypothetical protein
LPKQADDLRNLTADARRSRFKACGSRRRDIVSPANLSLGRSDFCLRGGVIDPALSDKGPQAGGGQLQPETSFGIAIAPPDAGPVLDRKLPSHSCTNQLHGDFDRSPALQTSRGSSKRSFLCAAARSKPCCISVN